LAYDLDTAERFVHIRRFTVVRKNMQRSCNNLPTVIPMLR
jgi:hypothetical protein